MPSIESIEQLHERLARLGDEPEIAAARGEIIEPPERPSESLDDDLTALLADTDDLAGDETASGEDTTSLLENLASLFGDEEPDGAAREGEEDPFSSLGLDEESAPPDFTFDPDQIPDELPAEIEGLEMPDEGDEVQPAAATGDEAGGQSDEEPVEPDDFDDLGDFGDLGADTADETDEPGAASDLGELGDLDDFGSLEDTLDDFGELETADGATGAGEEIEPAAPDDLDPGDGFAHGEPTGLDVDTDFGSGLGIPDLEESEDLEGEADFAEFETGADFGDDQLEADDFGGIEELEDSGDLPEFDAGPDLEPAAERGAGDGGLPDLDAELAAFGDESDDDLSGLGTTDDELGSLGFDEGFGSSVEQEFGDELNLDDTSIGGDPLDEMGSDFELPAVDDLDDEHFSLGDLGDEFEIGEESIDEFAGLDLQGGEIGDEALEEAAAAAGELPKRELSDEEFGHVQATLGTLPLNVRIATEETLAEADGSPDDLNALIDLLIAGASPSAVAEQLSKTLGRKIQVPRGYQKRTGLAFEEERRSWSYRFVHVVLPVARTAALVLAAVAVVGWLSYRFVYRPVHALILYNQGLEDAQERRFVEADETFERAYDLWPRNPWFSRYAEEYISQRQYQLAVQKYDQLVFGMNQEVRDFLREFADEQRFNEPVPTDAGPSVPLIDVLTIDREAILDHGRLQSETLADYQRAEDLFALLLHVDRTDYDALIESGDNYIRWAESEPDPYYEQARRAYARLLATYGDTDEILMRFLRLFVRTDNEQRAREVINAFEGHPSAVVHRRIYAEAAGYILDRERVADFDLVRRMLVRAYDAPPPDPDRPYEPEIFYQLARLAHRTDAFGEERDALDDARTLYDHESVQPLSREELFKSIDVDIRSGEYWYERDEVLRARGEFERARRVYEDAVEARILQPDATLGRVYEGLGDVEYYHANDLERALPYYQRAAATGHITDDLRFKTGFIHYENGDFDAAAEQFFSVGTRAPLEGNRNLLYARGNTLYRRDNLAGAEAYYSELLGELRAERDRISNLLVDEDPRHRALVEYLLRVQNNLGVTLYRQSQTGVTDGNRFAVGLDYMRQSAELSENYLRDEATAQRAAATSLAFLNIRSALLTDSVDAGESTEFRPQIYDELPRDLEQMLF